MRFGILALVLVGLLVLALAPAVAAPADPLLPYHLKSGEIAKLARDEASHLYAKGQDLTAIYDGGVDRYLKAGVLEASQFYYKSGKTTAEMVVLRLKSSKHAVAFYNQWKTDMGKGFTPVKFPKGQTAYGVTYVQQGATYGYACTKDFLITVTLDAKDARLAAAMMTASVAKMWK